MIDNTHYAKAGVLVQPIVLCYHADFIEGNIIKYICRWEYKGDPEGDLEKALDYVYMLMRRFQNDDEQKGWIDIDINLLAPFREKFPLLAGWLDEDGFYSDNSTSALSRHLKDKLNELQADAEADEMLKDSLDDLYRSRYKEEEHK